MRNHFLTTCLACAVALGAASRGTSQDWLDIERMSPDFLVDSANHLYPYDTVKSFLDAKLDGISHQQVLVNVESELAQRELERVQRELEEMNAQLEWREEILLELNLNANALELQISQLAMMKLELEIELTGLEAKRAASVQQLEEIRDRSSDSVENDVILAQLRNSLASKEQVLARSARLAERGVVSEAEVSEAMAAVTEAKIRLLSREEELLDGSAAPGFESVQNQLREIALSKSDLEARFELVTQRLNQLQQIHRDFKLRRAPQPFQFESVQARFESIKQQTIGLQMKLDLLNFESARYARALERLEAIRDADGATEEGAGEAETGGPQADDDGGGEGEE